MNFNRAMGDAFKRLAIQMACNHSLLPPHIEISGDGSKVYPYSDIWVTLCGECGARYSRPTVEQLQSEVPGVPDP